MVSKSSRKVKEKDFDKKAIVEPNLSFGIFQPGSLPSDINSDSGPYMDSTSVIEISLVQNHEYSDQIINRARKAFNLSKLEKFKGEKKPDKYLNEAKDQVKELYSCMETLVTHTALFKVSLLIAIGIILNDVEDSFGKKKEYMKWLRANFGHRHIRCVSSKLSPFPQNPLMPSDG